MPIYLGNTPQQAADQAVGGSYVQLDGEPFYRIDHYDHMPPFFMSIVSDSDHWMFISSNGALTAGRRNSENALFPYYTDDKIHDSHDLTGSKTLVLVEREGKTWLWEPFSKRYEGVYPVQRNLYKNVLGNKLLFEEINHELGVAFRYGWYSSEEFGFVKRSSIWLTGETPCRVELLDGLQNLLPYGVDETMQNIRSTLVDAYKKNELLPATGLGLFTLSSILVDKAEPSEALKATTVWSTGLPNARYLLCSRQLDDFRRGRGIEQEVDIRAERGAYFAGHSWNLRPGDRPTWYFVAELRQGPSEVAALQKMLRENDDLAGRLEADIALGSERLLRIVDSADGRQCTADQEVSYRHFSNVLFNLMRGGVFVDDYRVESADLRKFIERANRPLADKHASFLRSLPGAIDYPDLLRLAAETGDADLERQCYEYLPLTFSRRHGDPSRPWNRFSIELKAPDGSRSLYYQGNWRDIFQNWEALALSYPDFVESMVAKFVNASTPDGYNPYRVTRDGIDWEVIEPDDPWSYIGYWGDHQVIYLQKLLELSHRYHPGKLEAFLTRPLFAYANVPYRIKRYEELLKDPRDTVVFDDALEATIEERVRETGADGKLLLDRNGEVYKTNLTEKLLVMILAKFSNFIPEGGIWLNTQRPEWNDANNALVGNGVSMVTLYYIRRFLVFAGELFGRLEGPVEVSAEVGELLAGITQTLDRHAELLDGRLSDRDRKTILDGLGRAGSDYREQVYAEGFSGERRTIGKAELERFLSLALRYTDHSIGANRRADGLYHAYNLMSVRNEREVGVDHLYEMLEGQVAVLSAGFLSPDEAADLLRAVRQSALYRADQHTYLLYPDRRLPRFTEKNNLPGETAERSALILRLIADGNRALVEKDVDGKYHFNGSFNNAQSVSSALDELAQSGYRDLVEKDRSLILEAFEKIFDHQSFTGRSGTFFGYEGLGCVYWHMVSKLLLAAQENYAWARQQAAGEATLQALSGHYYDIRNGIGFNKTPAEYGAFPSDPYSHTPGNAGAQQPGMTGQVKEDILSRFGELGLVVDQGRIHFQPNLLRPSEFLPAPGSFSYFDLQGRQQKIELPAGSLAFTYCQVPVIYRQEKGKGLRLIETDGTVREQASSTLSLDDSASIFRRRGKIVRIEVAV